nr:MAG TPA: hypothetical protein [Caudoviricetes sp.]
MPKGGCTWQCRISDSRGEKSAQRKRSGTGISDGSVRTDQKICASSCFCALGSKQSDLFVVESIEFI